MGHIVFLLGALVILGINGLPVALFSTRNGSPYVNALPSPVIGACLLSVLTTIFYRWGIPPHVTLLGTTGVSCAILLGVFIRYWGKPCNKLKSAQAGGVDISLAVVCLLALVVVILLPHYLGGAQFAIFQGNSHDTVNYLSAAFGYANYPYEYLAGARGGAESVAGVQFAGDMLLQRPAVAILYAAFYKLLAPDFLTHAYEYCLVGQLNYYFALLYFVLVVFPSRYRVAHVVALAFAAGFFVQYIFDINAWSELFAVPMMLVMFTDYCRSMAFLGSAEKAVSATPGNATSAAFPTQSRARSVFLFLRVPLLGAGIIYTYPEISAVAALACGGAFVLSIADQLRRGQHQAAIRMVGFNAIVGALILLVAALCWQATMGFFLGQLHMATDVKISWQNFFQAYLLGAGPEVWTKIAASTGLVYLFLVGVAAPGCFLAGFLGLYYLQPQPVWTRPLDFGLVAWSVALLLWLGAVVVGIVVVARSELSSRAERQHDSLFRIMVAGALLAFVIPAGLYFKGQYWAAGKSLSMLCPLVFGALILPILSRQGNRLIGALVWLAVCGHIAFGIMRPVQLASHDDGVAFGYPYPSMAGVYKAGIDWDLGRHQREIESCTLIKIDVEQPFLERLVENYVIEKKIAWFSPNQLWNYYGSGTKLPAKNRPDGAQEDCQILTKPSATPGPRTILLDGK